MNITSKKSQLSQDIDAINVEFEDFLKAMGALKEDENNLQTYSPLEMVHDFEQRGLQKIKEVSHDEMLNDDDGLRKLLANMLAQCKPGALSDTDIERLGGINGREVRGQ